MTYPQQAIFLKDFDLRNTNFYQKRRLRRPEEGAGGGWRRLSPDRPTGSVGNLGRGTSVGF